MISNKYIIIKFVVFFKVNYHFFSSFINPILIIIEFDGKVVFSLQYILINSQKDIFQMICLILVLVAFFSFVPVVGYGQVESGLFQGNQSIVGNENHIRDINVGDTVLNFFSSRVGIPVARITNSPSAQEAVNKLNSLIEAGAVNPNFFRAGMIINYREDNNGALMYVKDVNGYVDKMDCYTGEIVYIGRLDNSGSYVDDSGSDPGPGLAQ